MHICNECVPGRHRRQCTHCKAGQFSCCCPSHHIQQAPVHCCSSTACNLSHHPILTLQPSSSFVPAGSGSVLPIPLVEWRPGSSFSTYSAYQRGIKSAMIKQASDSKFNVPCFAHTCCQVQRHKGGEDQCYSSCWLSSSWLICSPDPIILIKGMPQIEASHVHFTEKN